MNGPRRFLVFQTAFIGDVILTLPLIQTLRRSWTDASVTVVAIPSTAPLLANHPAIENVVVFDKRGKHAGFGGLLSVASAIKKEHVDVALVPHRSLRSAIACALGRVPRRIGFNTSAGRWLFTDVVRYDKNIHEVDRNLALLQPLGVKAPARELPRLFPSVQDQNVVDEMLGVLSQPMVAVAPGSVWNTKQWPEEHYTELVRQLVHEKRPVVLIGGKDDAPLAERIASQVGSSMVINTAGKLSLLQSAEVLRRCTVTVSNDSAPMHMSVAMQTPVVAIFGATVPRFGFAPLGEHDVVVETRGLPCRPCSIHGGESCPIKTFECMTSIRPERVLQEVLRLCETDRKVSDG